MDREPPSKRSLAEVNLILDKMLAADIKLLRVKRRVLNRLDGIIENQRNIMIKAGCKHTSQGVQKERTYSGRRSVSRTTLRNSSDGQKGKRSRSMGSSGRGSLKEQPSVPGSVFRVAH